jgi:hypothetical protein
VCDRCELNSFDAVQIDLSLLQRRHDVRNTDHRDFLDGLQPTETRTVRRIADVIGCFEGGRCCGRSAGQVCDAVGWSSGRCVRWFIQLDQLRLSIDDGHRVLLASRDGETVVLFDDFSITADHEFEGVRSPAGRIGDLHSQVVSCGAFDGSADVVFRSGGGSTFLGGCGGEFCSRADWLTITSDANDAAVAPTVQEVAVHGMREVSVTGEPAEDRNKLLPVGHHRRAVERAGLSEPHEGSHGSPDTLNGTRARIDFLDIDAWRKVGRHCTPGSTNGQRLPLRTETNQATAQGQRSGQTGCPIGQTRSTQTMR